MKFTAPDPASALIQEAFERCNAGEAGAARALLERAVEEAESANVRVQAYIELGKVHDTLGKRKSAQSCFRRVMSLTDDWTYRDEARRLFRAHSGRAIL